jgi:hypothetical protein
MHDSNDGPPLIHSHFPEVREMAETMGNQERHS